MKKLFIISYIFFGGLSCVLAQAVPTENISTLPLISSLDTLETITKSIDRRLAYFNRYIKARDFESIKTLVSEENKDFYANFLKYIESVPAFTLKRDASQKIIKTPQDDYTFLATMSSGKESAKIILTFLEEERDTERRWILLDSNLHIVGKTLPSMAPTVTTPKDGGLTAKSVTGDDIPSSTPKSTSSTASPQITAPVVGKKPLESAVIDNPTVSSRTPTTLTPVSTEGFGGRTLVGIIAGGALILVLLGGVYYVIKRKQALRRLLPALPLVSHVEEAPGVPFEAPLASPPSPLPMITPDSTSLHTDEVAPVVSTETAAPSDQHISNISLLNEEPVREMIQQIHLPEPEKAPSSPQNEGQKIPEPLSSQPPTAPLNPLFENIFRSDDSPKAPL